MAPEDTPREETNEGADERQYLYIIRHGDRWDYENPEVSESSI